MDKNSNTNQNTYQPFITKTLHFLVPVSIFSFFLVLQNLQYSTVIFTLLDRKYMFLICNGILAVLAKNLKLNSSNSNYVEIAEDRVHEITELPLVLKEEEVHDNPASEEYIGISHNVEVVEEQQDYVDSPEIEMQQEMKGGDFILESEDWEDEDDDDDDDEESGGLEGTIVNDASVSTEELNKKFEEFIRKMKEEIRIEARQQLIVV